MKYPVLYNEDCLTTMMKMLDQSISLVLADPPYGVTANNWDSRVDFLSEALRIGKVVVVTATQPYSSMLIARSMYAFRYEWIWHKTSATGFLNAKRQPLRAHEHVLVFSRGRPPYWPQMSHGNKPTNRYTKHTSDGSNYGRTKIGVSGGGNTTRYPRSVITFGKDKQKSSLHPTQKPLELFKYLINTYTKEGDTVYDPFMGSGTAAVAAKDLGREFIGSEISNDYYNTAMIRLAETRVGSKE